MTKDVQISDTDLFARVIDGVIVEFPVFRLHIRNRAHPIEWYTRATEVAKPTLPPFHQYVQEVNLVGADVVVSYTTQPFTLQQMLSSLWPDTLDLNPASQAAPKIEDVPTDVVEQIYKLVKNYATEKLDAFAASRGYDNIGSLSNWRDSHVQKYAMEGQAGYALMGDTWEAFELYCKNVSEGTLPIPRTVAEIDAHFPPLRW